MSARILVAVMTIALAMYIVLVGHRAVLLVLTGEPTAVAMGIALIILPLVGAWGIGREIWFGVQAERLGRRMENEGSLPQEELTVSPSGRVAHEDADALFPGYRDAVEQAPEDWRAWYRLGLVYDAAGDRKRARGAVRRAITLEGATR